MLQALSQFANKIQRAETGRFSFVFERLPVPRVFSTEFHPGWFMQCHHMHTHAHTHKCAHVHTYSYTQTFIARGKRGGEGGGRRGRDCHTYDMHRRDCHTYIYMHRQALCH